MKKSEIKKSAPCWDNTRTKRDSIGRRILAIKTMREIKKRNKNVFFMEIFSKALSLVHCAMSQLRTAQCPLLTAISSQSTRTCRMHDDPCAQPSEHRDRILDSSCLFYTPW